MRGVALSNGLYISMNARLKSTTLTPIALKYHWEYELHIRNLRSAPITILASKIILHDGAARLREISERGVLGSIQPTIQASKSLTFVKSLSTQGNAILYGAITFLSDLVTFTSRLPNITLESPLSAAIHSVN